MKIGDTVVFHDTVQEPQYEDYKGGIYRIVAFHEWDYVELEALHGSVPVQGHVPSDDLEVLW